MKRQDPGSMNSLQEWVKESSGPEPCNSLEDTAQWGRCHRAPEQHLQGEKGAGKLSKLGDLVETGTEKHVGRCTKA